MPNDLCRREEPQPSIIEEIVEASLVGWSGLRLYLRRRRAGGPADDTMDALLSEVLRTNLGDNTNIRRVIDQITCRV